MAELMGSFEGRYFRATLYDNHNAPDMQSHEVILTRKTHPRDLLLIDAGSSEPCELVEVAATLVALGGNWDEGPARRKSSEWHFEIEMRREESARLAHVHFYERTPGEPEPRWIPVYGPDEATDLLAVAKGVAARHAELNLLRRGFDPDHRLILTLTHGRFQAELFEYVHVLGDGSSDWPVYRAALYADRQVLWPPDHGAKCDLMRERLKEEGKDWLNNYLIARALPPAAKTDLLDFPKTLVEAELRCCALWERGQDRWREANKERLGRAVREIAGPQRATDFRIEELGSESWKVTPLTPQASDYVERPGVKQGSWQRNGEAYLLGSSWVALDLMRHLATCGFLLENHWLDPLRKPVAGPAAEHVPERDIPPPKERPSSTDVREGDRMKEHAPHGHPPKADAEGGELKQYVFRVDQWWAFSSLACVEASSLEEGERLAADEAWVDKEHGQRESIRATLLEVEGRPAEREHAPGPRPEDFDTYPAYIRERVESFEKILARYPDTAEHGRLVCLLADARHWADQHEVDFGLCLGLSKELHANEVKEQAVTPEEEPGPEPGY